MPSIAKALEKFRKRDPNLPRDPETSQVIPSRIQGIRSRLGMAMALAMLPFILLGLAQARGEYQRQADDLKYDLQLAAHRNVAEAANILDRTSTMLLVLAPEASGTYCSTRLEVLSERVPEIVAIYRLDRNGQVACASDDKATERLGDLSQSAWFNTVRETDTGNLIETVSDTQNQTAYALQIHRITRPLGDFEGAMVAVLNLEALEKPLATLAPNTPSDTALFNKSGEPLSPDLPDVFKLPNNAMQKWIAENGSTGTIWAATADDGIKRIYASAPLGQLDALAVIAAPVTSPWFWVSSRPIQFLMMPLAACLTAFAAVMFASERIIIRWLDYLDRIAAIYARGRYTVRPIQAENAPLEIRHLAQTMDELGDNITKRDAALTEALNEKDALLREIHHRVKNNLQIISSLLSMQQRAVSDASARAVLGDTRQRISALALIYRTLYQGTDVRFADSKMFLEELVGHLISAESLRGPLVSSSVHAESLQIDPDKLAPMALWLVEAISNAQKHAFANRGGDLKVRFSVNGETSILEVEDDGPGIPSISPGVGMTLMNAFAKQLRGTAEMVEGENGGAIARLRFQTPSLEN